MVRARALLRIFGWLAGSFLFAILFLLVLLRIERGTATTLPQPSGHYPVGRTTYAWTNESLTDTLAPAPQPKRQVRAWIWYPATAASGVTADYQPKQWSAAIARYSGVLFSGFLTRDSEVVRTHSTIDPAVSAEQPAYPVVILRAGLGALTTDYTVLAEDLASHGYIVAGFDAPYRTTVFVYPDGHVIQRPAAYNPEDMGAADQERLMNKILPMWVEDTGFVVDQLTGLNQSGRFAGHLNLQQLGVAGHSLGGATALEFCHQDARCKAAIDIDGNPFGRVVLDGITRPALILLSDHGDLSSGENRPIIEKMRAIFERLPRGSLFLAVRGANHFSFTDHILLKSQYFVRAIIRLRGGLAPERGLAVTAAYVNAFFDVSLKGQPARTVEDLRGTYPEVTPALGR